MTDKPTIPSTAKSVVANLRASQDFEGWDDWRIDYAHRLWSVSDEFPDESLIACWLQPDTDNIRRDYINLTVNER